MGLHTVPTKETYYVFRHRMVGEEQEVEYYTECRRHTWSKEWKESLELTTLDNVIWIATMSKAEGWTVCVGKNITQVDPHFPIIVV